MKTQKISHGFGLFLLIIIAVGCVQSTQSVTTSPSKASALLTSTPFATAETVISTITPIATNTPKAVPTLPTGEAGIRLLDLLASNGGCRLPCLWGITPGKNDYQDAQNILIPLSSISAKEDIYFKPTKLRGILFGTISPIYIDGEQYFNSLIAYYHDDDGVVNNITFRVREEQVIKDSNGNRTGIRPIYDSPTFITRTEYYSLHHLLTEQGVPDSVLIYTSGQSNRGGSIRLDIAIFYPNQGIWAQYETSVNEFEVGNIIKICPIHTHVEMELYPPGNPDNFYKLLDQTDWHYTKGGFKILKEATSISIEEFYQTFRNPTDQCLETPVNIWPPPS